MDASDFPEVVAEIWPDNETAFRLFYSLRTQWRIGMGGATGLDYNPLFHKMDRMGLPPDEYEQMEEDVRLMESAALRQMSSK